MNTYGSKVEEKLVPVVGTKENPFLNGVTIVGLELSEDGTRFTMTFKQPNGALVKVTEFAGTEDWQIDQTNRRVRHIATKIVSVEEYESAIKETNNFADFISRVVSIIGNRYANMEFNMLFVYNKKGFVTIPSFPNFIEVSGTMPSTLILSDFNARLLVKPEVKKPENATEPEATSDLPF